MGIITSFPFNNKNTQSVIILILVKTLNTIYSISELALEIPEGEFPSFYGWIEIMKSTYAVKQSYITPEAHAAIIKSNQENGTPDYSHVGTTAQGVPITFYAKQN